MSASEFVYVTVIAVPPEKVWKAITTAEFTRQYWHATRVQSDWQEGGEVRFLVDDEGGERVGCEGRILAVDPPRRLSYTWHFSTNPLVAGEEPSRVTFELDDLGGHTRLTVVHDRFSPDSKTQPMVTAGWPLVLSGLKTLLETGRAVDFSSME